MRYTFPVYVSVECDGEQDGRKLMQQLMTYSEISTRGRLQGNQMTDRKLSFTIGHGVLGEWNPANEKPSGRPKVESPA